MELAVNRLDLDAPTRRSWPCYLIGSDTELNPLTSKLVLNLDEVIEKVNNRK